MKAKRVWFVRIGLTVVCGGLLALGGEFEQVARGQVGLSVALNINSPADFYSPLAPYGSWVDVSQYGRCWRPAGLPVGWRPYTIGHWEWSDCGWYWVSDDPWGWACYHYGYWTFDPVNGWIWIPGTEWAPAWVVWREAPDYIGWAPCGPGGEVFTDTSFVFVDVHHFHDRLRPQELVFNDPAIIRRSHRVGRLRTESRDFDGMRRQIAINQGPSIDPIQRATGTRFTQRPVTELVRQTPIPESARRTLAQPSARPTRQVPPEPTGRQQQRLYREAPATPPPPTGRQEQRLYREAPRTQPREVPTPQPREVPTPQPAPRPWQPPVQPVPRREPRPEVSQPSVNVPQRTLPPTGRSNGEFERQVPRRSEPAPRVEPPPAAVPAPSPVPAPVAPPRGPQEREKHRGDGQS